MPILVTILVLAFAVPFFGQSPSIPSLDQVTTDYVAAFNAKDAARLASFYTEDGELMAPGSLLFKGRESIEAALQSTFQQDNALALMSVESETIGARAYDAGRFALTLGGVTDTGMPEVVGGRYLTVFKRVGDEWKMAYHMYYVESTQVSEP
jgi:ketosteroid isomerase-like protein